MPNAKSLKTGKKNILVYGPTGSGKTTLFTTLPGRKFLYLFDPSGLDSIKGLDIDYEFFPPDDVLGVWSTLKKGRTTVKGTPQSYQEFEDHLEKILNGDRFKEYDVIGFSSVTMLSNIMMDYLLHLQARFGRVPELSDYNLLGISLINTFKPALALQDKIIFLEGHSDLTQDDVSKRIVNQFDVTKNVRRIIPRLCSDIWVSEGSPEGEDMKYRIQTAPSKEFPQAKNSFSLKPFEDVTIDLKKPREGQGAGRWFE
jgi:hypothetical protein